jgi:hypothetical protein
MRASHAARHLTVMRPRITRSLLACLVAALGAAAFFAAQPRFAVWQHVAGSQLLAHGDEAYVFLNVRHHGWRGTWTGMELQKIRNRLGGSTLVTDDRRDLIVFHCFDGEWRRVVLKNLQSSHVTVFNGELYARVNRVSCRWTGSRFDPIGELQSRILEVYGPASEVGWVNEANLLGFGRNTTVHHLRCGERAIDLVTRNDFTSLSHAMDVRDDQGRTRLLWSGHSRGRLVSEQEYRDLFSSSD